MTTDTILIYKREDKRLSFTITEDEIAVDISEATLNFRVSRRKGEAYLIEKTGSLTTDGTDGKCYFTVLAEDTDLNQGYYNYEVEVIMADGNTYLAEDGDIIFLSRVEL